MSMKHPALFIAQSTNAGRGVFSTQDLSKGDAIESCPVIVIPKLEVPLIHKTFLHDYYFIWKKGKCAIALGYGSLYNHSPTPNADYEMDFQNQTIDVFCTKDIKAGEEITVSYILEDDTKKKLWFEVEKIGHS